MEYWDPEGMVSYDGIWGLLEVAGEKGMQRWMRITTKSILELWTIFMPGICIRSHPGRVILSTGKQLCMTGS